MLEDLDDALRDMVRAEHGEGRAIGADDDDDDLPGLFYPLDYVLLTWFEKKEHGILPEPGGLNDQDWRLVYHDWPLVSKRYNRIDRELYPPKDDNGRTESAIRIPDPGSAHALQDIL